MKGKIIQVNDDYEIVHSHHNFQGETDFVAWNKKTDFPNAGHIVKSNCIIDWDNPLTDDEIDYLISK